MQSSICSHIRLGYRICVKALLWLYLMPAGRPVTDVTNVTLSAEKLRTKQEINLNMGKSHAPSCVLEWEHHSPPWAAWETACFIMTFTTGCKEIFTFPVPVWVPPMGDSPCWISLTWVLPTGCSYSQTAPAWLSCEVTFSFRHPPAPLWSPPQAAGRCSTVDSFTHHSPFNSSSCWSSSLSSTSAEKQQHVPSQPRHIPTPWLLSKRSQAQISKVLSSTSSKSKKSPLSLDSNTQSGKWPCLSTGACLSLAEQH